MRTWKIVALIMSLCIMVGCQSKREESIIDIEIIIENMESHGYRVEVAEGALGSITIVKEEGNTTKYFNIYYTNNKLEEKVTITDLEFLNIEIDEEGFITCYCTIFYDREYQNKERIMLISDVSKERTFDEFISNFYFFDEDGNIIRENEILKYEMTDTQEEMYMRTLLEMEDSYEEIGVSSKELVEWAESYLEGMLY